MTTRNLRRLGKRLNRPPKALRFDRGTVLDVVDAAHVRVFLDESRQPIAWIPEYLQPAIGVGQEVIVRTQGSTYAVDSIITGGLARMLTLPEITALQALLPPPAGNLVPNPGPYPYTDNIHPPTSWPPSLIMAISETGWACADESAYVTIGLGPAGSPYCLRLFCDVGPQPAYVTPGGTGGIAVTAGNSYSLQCEAGNWDAYEGESVTACVGAVWYDSGGSEISTSRGGALPLDAVMPWVRYTDTNTEGWWEGAGSALTDVLGCVPTGSLTAPTGAAFARPFCEFDSVEGGKYRVAKFNFSAA